jgi:precorrin-6Y C5,15-methyltransferase (decarboxylating)
MIPVQVIGMGLGPEDLTARHLKIIDKAQLLIGGRRHLAHFKDHPGKKRAITGDMRGLISEIRKEMKRGQVVVLASGDPSFFGIGPLLARSLGAENVMIHPNTSSVAAAFCRIKESWHDATVVSLHGERSEKSFLDAIARDKKVAVLTDFEKTPGWLARQLIEAGHERVSMCVLENLGAPEERIAWYLPAEAAGKKFAALNVVIVLRLNIAETSPGSPLYLKDHPQLHLGMPEGCYHHEAGLITKAEVRAISISKLRLWPGLTLWDLGAGSASVALEASLLLRGGKIIAVEQNPERLDDIRQNKKRFKVDNLDIVQARLPGGMKALPTPDRIFIGGGGKDLLRIIKAAGSHLKPGGVMVINTILFGSLDRAIATLQGLGFSTEVVQVQVSRSKTMPPGERLEALNPVWILSGYR